MPVLYKKCYFFVILVIGESFYTFNEHIKRFLNEKTVYLWKNDVIIKLTIKWLLIP